MVMVAFYIHSPQTLKSLQSLVTAAVNTGHAATEDTPGSSAAAGSTSVVAPAGAAFVVAAGAAPVAASAPVAAACDVTSWCRHERSHWRFHEAMVASAANASSSAKGHGAGSAIGTNTRAPVAASFVAAVALANASSLKQNWRSVNQTGCLLLRCFLRGQACKNTETALCN